MYLDASEELTSMHNKIRNIQDRLQNCSPTTEDAQNGSSNAGRKSRDEKNEPKKEIVDAEACSFTTSETSSLASYSSKAGVLRRLSKRLRQKSELLKDIVHRQTFYAYCLKLLALFIIALVHFFYIRPFLDTLSLLEDYSAKVDTKFAGEHATGKPHNAAYDRPLNEAKMILRREVDVLNDYKKNVWMTVAAMCVALSTSCFFLFILPITRTVRRFHLCMIGVVDLVAFAALPLLLVVRAELVLQITEGLPEALRVAHRLVSAERLMNALQCTIHPREKLAFCSDILVDSVFPVILLKYLVILCVLTLVYILLAYLIDYCLRHWFPPHHVLEHHALGCTISGSNSTLLFCNGTKKDSNQCYPECSCCLLPINSSGYAKNGSSKMSGIIDDCWTDDCSWFHSYSKKTLKNKSYLPALLMPMKSDAKNNVGKEFFFGVRPQMPTLLPNPLVEQLSPTTTSASKSSILACNAQQRDRLINIQAQNNALESVHTETQPIDPK